MLDVIDAKVLGVSSTDHVFTIGGVADSELNLDLRSEVFVSYLVSRLLSIIFASATL